MVLTSTLAGYTTPYTTLDAVYRDGTPMCDNVVANRSKLFSGEADLGSNTSGEQRSGVERQAQVI
ncbi:MAG: hypothetical protein ACKN82_05715 [Pirellula sp.]